MKSSYQHKLFFYVDLKTFIIKSFKVNINWKHFLNDSVRNSENPFICDSNKNIWQKFSKSPSEFWKLNKGLQNPRSIYSRTMTKAQQQ